MVSDDVRDDTREPIRLRSTGATPDPARPQVLVRRVEARRGWFRPARYEVAHHPEGLATSPWWVRTVTSSTAIPGSTHTTDLHDLAVLVGQARDEGEGRWTAWPVHYPAVARRQDLRPVDAAERRGSRIWGRRSTPEIRRPARRAV